LVLAGHTHFLNVRVPLLRGVTGPWKVRFRVVAQESCVTPTCPVTGAIDNADLIDVIESTP
jgi:hypothetical protein